MAGGEISAVGGADFAGGEGLERVLKKATDLNRHG
jgi:hypothetical protein